MGRSLRRRVVGSLLLVVLIGGLAGGFATGLVAGAAALACVVIAMMALAPARSTVRVSAAQALRAE